MDALLTSALGSIPQLGGAGLLVLIIVLLLRREGTELARVRAAYDAEVTRIREDHDEDLADKNEEIKRLRAQVRQLDQDLWDLPRRTDAGRHRGGGG